MTVRGCSFTKSFVRRTRSHAPGFSRDASLGSLIFLGILASTMACSSSSDSNGTGQNAVTPDGGAQLGGGAGSGGSSATAGNGGSATSAGGANNVAGSTNTAGASPGGGVNGGGGSSVGGFGGTGGIATSAGGSSTSAGGTRPITSDGGCTALGTACDPNSTICCSNLICVQSTSPDYAGCREPCTTASDCQSGCCIPFANLSNKGFCGAATLCQCAGQDETCGGTRHCCSGYACSTFDNTGALACHKSCTQNSDCTTNCCVKVTGTSDSVCLSPTFCGH